ncbi:hypothetical protein Golomagni_06551, partial [Golovinomyces magnicellulatus]
MLLTFYFLFILHVASNPYDYGFDAQRLMRRQDSTSRIVVSSLPLAANGSIPIRPEIRDMRKDRYTWDLFILGLSMLQYVDQNHPLSWYQIAGIHGVPFRPWNGVQPVVGAQQSGYCTHSSVLFPTWHRPYLALYEVSVLYIISCDRYAYSTQQELYKLVNAIAALFPNAAEKTKYQQAASVFRIPYWDWSIMAPAGGTHLPESFWSPVISQYGPNGMQNIRNPLYSYTFHPLNEDDLIWAPLTYWNETKRAPDTGVSKTAPPSRNDQASAALLSKLPEIQQRLYILFSKYHDFNSFSNKAWAASQRSTSLDSIESVHDVIHVYGGSKGHMTYVPLSSFDPLFFLHHAMTDRLVSMWQVLNPSAWIEPMAAGETTYTALKGTMQSSTTPLTPFYSSSDGKFWTSDASRTTEIFGYTYTDTNPHHGDKDAVRQTLVKKINAMYGASSPAGIRAKAKQDKPSTETLPLHWSRKVIAWKRFQPNVKLAAQDPPIESVVQDEVYNEWIANVQVNVEALDGRFNVHLFIGSPPSD